jgi:hypothetical protein
MAVSAAMVIENCINVIVNHPHQWTPLLNPIILMTLKKIVKIDIIQMRKVTDEEGYDYCV